jgi:hypothetical protein
MEEESEWAIESASANVVAPGSLRIRRAFLLFDSGYFAWMGLLLPCSLLDEECPPEMHYSILTPVMFHLFIQESK